MGQEREETLETSGSESVTDKTETLETATLESVMDEDREETEVLESSASESVMLSSENEESAKAEGESVSLGSLNLYELLNDPDLTEEEKLAVIDDPSLYFEIKKQRSKTETVESESESLETDKDNLKQPSVLFGFRKRFRALALLGVGVFASASLILLGQYFSHKHQQQVLEQNLKKQQDLARLFSKIESYNGEEIDAEQAYVEISQEIENFFKEVEDSPANRQKRLYLRGLLRTKNITRTKEAIADLTTLIEEAQKSGTVLADYFYARGIAYRKLKDYDKALADFNQALDLQPSDWKALVARADLYNEKKEFDLAILDYTRALALLVGKEPQPRAYYGLALAYLGKENLKLAVFYLREARSAAQEVQDVQLYQEIDQLLIELEKKVMELEKKVVK